MSKWRTLSISCKASELLDRIKEETGANKAFIIEKATEEYFKNHIKKESN